MTIKFTHNGFHLPGLFHLSIHLPSQKQRMAEINKCACTVVPQHWENFAEVGLDESVVLAHPPILEEGHMVVPMPVHEFQGLFHWNTLNTTGKILGNKLYRGGCSSVVQQLLCCTDCLATTERTTHTPLTAPLSQHPSLE
eukprot:TRINITY_DN65711_c12_g3_i2.p1 TRINITY_DN65711_c12_g3~~TRINITY_DN65711_c12_g3_i2.p1  ORF type:complete len:140 (-),score=9.53 TRINITY_DN65711_c12_g3_i2:17-436(-)